MKFDMCTTSQGWVEVEADDFVALDNGGLLFFNGELHSKDLVMMVAPGCWETVLPDEEETPPS